MPDNPIADMAEALHAADRANLRLFLALDNAVSEGLTDTLHLPTTVLFALDTARIEAANLGYYMEAPAVKKPGPTQDQTAKQQYDMGLLTVQEYDRLVAEEEQAAREAADNAEPNILALGGWLRTPETVSEE